jgi:hypothetical protein
VALGLQLAIFVPTEPLPFLRGREPVVHAASYAVLGPFLWVNRRLPGMWLVILGFSSNAAAILANGGLMPASEEALRTAGRWTVLQQAGMVYKNSTVIGLHTKLWFLGDVFALPQGVPLANVFSIGDALLALGVFVLVPPLMGGRPFDPREAAVACAAAGFLLGLLVGTVRVPAALREAAQAPTDAEVRPAAAEPSPALTPQPAPATSASLPTGRYTVQVGAFRQRENAEAVVRRLRAQGYDAQVVSGALVRVWVGRFEKEPAARRLAKDLARAGYPAFVRRVP